MLQLPEDQRWANVHANAAAKAAARKTRLHGPGYGQSLLLNALSQAGDSNMLNAMMFGPEYAAAQQRNQNWMASQDADRQLRREELSARRDDAKAGREFQAGESEKGRKHQSSIAANQFSNTKTLAELNNQYQSQRDRLQQKHEEKMQGARSSEQLQQFTKDHALKQAALEDARNQHADSMGFKKQELNTLREKEGLDPLGDGEEKSAESAASTGRYARDVAGGKEGILADPQKYIEAKVKAKMGDLDTPLDDPAAFQQEVVSELVAAGMPEALAIEEYKKAVAKWTSAAKTARNLKGLVVASPLGPLINNLPEMLKPSQWNELPTNWSIKRGQ